MADMANMVYDKLDEAFETYKFFITGDWEFETNKIHDLVQLMPKDQSQVFKIEIETMDWPTYLRNFIIGLSIWC